MKKLGSITLPDTLQWESAMQSQGVSTVHRRALDGSLVTFSGPANRSIVLVAGGDYGWFSTAEAESVIALASSSGGALLTWEDVEIPVRFDHSAGPAVALVPLRLGAAWYTGTISLIRED